MSRRHRSAPLKHDDFLSESSLSSSSGEEDDVDTSVAPYRDSPSSLGRTNNDVKRSKGYGLAAVNSGGSSEEDEEKLIGGNVEAEGKAKGKKDKRRWVMNSGEGVQQTQPVQYTQVRFSVFFRDNLQC
jgi:hypothetical protein